LDVKRGVAILVDSDNETLKVLLFEDFVKTFRVLLIFIGGSHV